MAKVSHLLVCSPPCSCTQFVCTSKQFILQIQLWWKYFQMPPFVLNALSHCLQQPSLRGSACTTSFTSASGQHTDKATKTPTSWGLEPLIFKVLPAQVILPFFQQWARRVSYLPRTSYLQQGGAKAGVGMASGASLSCREIFFFLIVIFLVVNVSVLLRAVISGGPVCWE